MVKIGFLVEGDTEKKIIVSENFKNLCETLQLEVLRSVFPPKGQRGKDVFKNSEKLNSFINILKDQGAKFVFVVRDLEDLDCVLQARKEIANDTVKKVIVVKAIESWFLADTTAIRLFFNDPHFECSCPEEIEKPFEEIKQINIQKRGRGVSDKLILAGNMLKNGFSIESAAKHSNCPSAKYFLTKLRDIRYMKYDV